MSLPVQSHAPVLAGNLTVELTRDHRERLAALAVPGAGWSRERGAYVVVNPSPRASAAVIALFPEALVAHPELIDIRNSEYGNVRPYDYATELGIRLDAGPLGPVNLYDWQDIDGGYMHAILERDKGVFPAWDRGLGKTVLAAGFIQKLQAQRTLVVARNDAKEPVWLKQLTTNPGLLPDYDVRVFPDPGPKRERFMQRMAEDWQAAKRGEPARPLVLIVHYEALAWIAGPRVTKHRDGSEDVVKAGGDGWKRLGRWNLMVFDEGHRLATFNPNSKRNTQMGRALEHLRTKYVDMAVNLTGSAVMNHPEDLFGQLHYLYPNIYHAKWADWNDRFIDYVDDGRHQVAIGFKSEVLPELRKELGVFMVYRRKEEVFDLPELIHQDLELELYPEQRRVYDEMRDQFWTRVESGEPIKAINPLDQLNKLRRIATYYPGVPSVKFDFVLRELEAYPDDQFVIFTWYKDPGHALAERLGDDVVVVDGDVPPKHRPELLARHEAGKVRVLVGSIATIGESLNLQYMHEAIRLDRDWNPQVNGQTLDRLHRHGQQARVTVRDLWAAGTVDTLRVKPRLASKDSLRKAVFGA